MNPLFRSRRPRAKPAASSSSLSIVSLFGLAALLVAHWLAISPALAQETQIQALVDRIDRLQRELVTLQRQVYRGEPPPPAESVPAAPAATGEGLNTTAAARIELRLSQLEAQLGTLTGTIEEAGYRQSQLRAQIDRLASDVDTRLRRLEQANLAGGGGETLPGAAPADGQTAAAGAGASSPLADTSPKILGTVKADDLAALRSEKVEPASPGATPQATQETPPEANTAALQGTTAKEQYEYAFGLLRQADYGAAEAALRAFVEAHPEDPLAGNAKYWLGETYYVRQDYQQAAITFAEAYQQYPDNQKAPDNLLKLGMSLASLGSKADACGTFAELLKRYTDAPATVRQRAKRERQRLACP